MNEVETKILNVDKSQLESKLNSLGAKKILDTKLVVNWYRPQGCTDGQDPWFLRIRSYSDGKSEVTWKGKSTVLGVARQHPEINLLTSEPTKLSELFKAIGLELYAHQEKYRLSWILDDYRFDLDQYPQMPAYLEIEGQSEDHIQAAIKLLDLTEHEASSEGERVLIQTKYSLNWHDMKF